MRNPDFSLPARSLVPRHQPVLCVLHLRTVVSLSHSPASMADGNHFLWAPSPSIDEPFTGDSQHKQGDTHEGKDAWEPIKTLWNMDGFGDGFGDDFPWQSIPSVIPLSPFPLGSDTEISCTNGLGHHSALHMSLEKVSAESSLYDNKDSSIAGTSPTGSTLGNILIPSPPESLHWTNIENCMNIPCGTHHQYNTPATGILPLVSDAKLQIPRFQSIRNASQSSVNRFQCPQCDKGFGLQKDFVRHNQSIHLDVRLWFCNAIDCKFATQGFNRKDKYLQHIKTHERGPSLDSADARMKDANMEVSSLEIKVSEDTIRPNSRASTLDFSSCTSDTESSHQEREKLYKCPISECKSSFANRHDLVRHRRTVHINRDVARGYMCASQTCRRPEKVWTRLDSFKKHVKSRHEFEDMDSLIQKSFRWCVRNHVNFPMKIVTPQTFPRPSATTQNGSGGTSYTFSPN